MAKKDDGLSAVGFDEALKHMKVGKKAVRRVWQKNYILHMRIDDTGLGSMGEFIRLSEDARSTRYPPSTEDILANDWVLL